MPDSGTIKKITDEFRKAEELEKQAEIIKRDVLNEFHENTFTNKTTQKKSSMHLSHLDDSIFFYNTNFIFKFLILCAKLQDIELKKHLFLEL
ncbi:hypothetical protein V7O66_01550 [Methanolobus sp. ZRKC3]|uniref:hypothetical protein n=1 Tax=Methanolobus sp. ZRKC3 TaxID=3125786 RepID=UPI0032524A17